MLTSEEKEEEYSTLQAQRAELKEKKDYGKITTVLMLHEGFTPAQISSILGISTNVIKDMRRNSVGSRPQF
jgi:transposase-like protein